MSRPTSPHQPARREAGYALLFVVFLAAVMLIAVAAAAPNLLTQGIREREDETIWRGEQYARAVKLFYRRNGRFPQSLDDITKPKNNIRFLRKPYPDPMNAADGSWRLIYVGPGGQLIGSVKQRGLINLAGAQPAGAQQAAAPPPGQGPPTPSRTGSQPMQTPLPTGDQPQSTVPPDEQVPPPPAAAPPAPATASSSASSAGSETKLFGGNIIGVGSKVNRRSIKVYDGGTTYREWEFIWDPTKEAAIVAQPGAAAGRPTAGQQQNPPQNPPNPNPPL